jgi:hypothetical protein
MPEEKKKIRKGKLWLIKLSLLAITIVLVVIDTRLTISHMANSFIHFRRASLVYSAFTFGVTFWAFVLAFPLALIRFGKLGFRHRFVILGLAVITSLLSAYLIIFLITLKR